MSTHMILADIAPRLQYVADGYQKTFPFPFPLFAASDLRVYVGDTLTTGGFTISGIGSSTGGSVTFTTAPPIHSLLTLSRQMTIERQTDFQEGGALRAKVMNDALDYQTAVLQELGNGLSRAVRLSPSARDGVDTTLPPAAPGKAIGWSEDGSCLVNDPTDFSQTVLTVQQWAENADGTLQLAEQQATTAQQAASVATAASQAASASQTATTQAAAGASASAAVAGSAATAATTAARAAEAEASAAAWTAFVSGSAQRSAATAATAAAASASLAEQRASLALSRAESIDLVLWQGSLAARTAQQAASSATTLAGEVATLLDSGKVLRTGITPGTVLPNWAR